MKKILIINQGKTENYGDIAINETIVKYFKKQGYATEQFPFWIEREVFGKRYDCYGKYIRRLLWILPFIFDIANIRYISKNFKNIKTFDAVIIGGGELMYSHRGFNSSLFMWSKFLNKKNVPLYLYGVSGDTKMRKNRIKRYKKALNLCTKVIVRDKKTQEICKNVYNIDSIYKPDVVFAYNLVNKINKIEGCNRNALLCVPIRYNAKIKEKFNFNSEAEYFEYLKNKIDKEIKSIGKIYVTSTTFNDDESSKRFYDYLSDKYTIDIHYEKYSCLENYIKLLNMSKIVISGRMHAMILGLINGCKIEPIEFKEKLEVFKEEFYNIKDITKVENEAFEGLELLEHCIDKKE